LAPGASIESLGVGGLTLNAGSNLDFELGAGGAADQITVAGLLNLNGGTLNLQDAGGMAAGMYTLIAYGTLSGSVANLGAPVGPSAFQYSLSDTGTSIVLSVTPVGLDGDFNLDGSVDAADYVVWRQGLGATYTQADYDTWRAHFGQTAGSGTSEAVPEPSAIILVLSATSGLARRRRHDLIR